ncbi:MAG: GntR family transcriptional regulator [Actinomycetaceae bacterium]|nr:GntR family transcriptional regulator [Actinomycetaceae bacterium]
MHLDDTRPIWVQLAEDFRRRIASGQWQSGEKIPSVRELAVDIGVNPNTVQRALGQLDREGLTVTERTSGRFVAPENSAASTMRAELAAAATNTYIDTVAALGLDLDETIRTLSDQWKARTEGDD